MSKKKCEKKKTEQKKSEGKKYICSTCCLGAGSKKKLCEPKKNK